MLIDPGREAIESKLVVFDNSVPYGKTPYQGYPTEKSEKLWKELYYPMFSRITLDETRIIPNEPAAEGDTADYDHIINMSVFHDLQCLHGLRTFFYHFLDPSWNRTSNPYTQYASLVEELAQQPQPMSPEALDHCIDMLRQSTMCAVDITPKMFLYSSEHAQMRPGPIVPHECRNFDKIKQWAVDHAADEFAG